MIKAILVTVKYKLEVLRFSRSEVKGQEQNKVKKILHVMQYLLTQ